MGAILSFKVAYFGGGKASVLFLEADAWTASGKELRQRQAVISPLRLREVLYGVQRSSPGKWGGS